MEMIRPDSWRLIVIDNHYHLWMEFTKVEVVEMDSSTFHHFLQNGLGDVLFKLRDIEWVKGYRHGRLQQQFTPSYVMVVVTGGNGRLTLETEGHQLRKDAVYLCPPHATFGIDSESLEEIERKAGSLHWRDSYPIRRAAWNPLSYHTGPLAAGG